jgi:hypothetical protein
MPLRSTQCYFAARVVFWLRLLGVLTLRYVERRSNDLPNSFANLEPLYPQAITGRRNQIVMISEKIILDPNTLIGRHSL